MKKINTKSSLFKIVICLAICAVCVGIGVAAGVFSSVGSAFSGIRLNLKSLLNLIVMAAFVMAAENVVLLVLRAVNSKNPRVQTFISILGNALRYVAAIIILCRGLYILGADVKTIVASMGILALIIGFGANSLIADLVIGLFLIFENQYNVGDFVEVGGFRGRVTSIGIRTTCLEDAGGNIKIINNSEMSNILNRSDRSSRAVSTISISYETDLLRLEEKLPAMMEGIFSRHGDIMLSKPEYLGVDELADSAVVLKFVVEVKDENIFSAGRALNRELFLCFRSAGVEVPFPQLDVHSK